MPIRILFEIGHKAVRKAKPLDAFTHDWELFVRGSDGKEMSKYVEKIVFNLHESFPNPIRTQRDPPYVLKEAGYGGFLLPIDIFFKAGPRDEPKFLSITYDLDITKPQHVFKYNHTFMNPSTEFRHKLLEGGGLLINHEGHEDRSQSESRSRCQVSSTTTASTGGKKHKISKAEEGKPLSEFENLFGPPIHNVPAKRSPATTSTDSHKTQKLSSKERSSDKNSKEKKDRNKSSSAKDANNSKETFSKKSSTDEKNERRDDKRKDKSHGKDHDRSKEKSLKRPISPKSESRSPKRSTSPASHRTTSSNNSRHEPKLNDDKSGNGGKKSKKEKRDKSKECDRLTTSDNKKDNKEIKHQTQTSTKQKDERSTSNKMLEKLNGSGKRDESTGSNTPKDLTSRDKPSNSYRPAYDTKPPSPIDLPPQTKPQAPSDTKKSDKHDKDGSERKHKHKKEKKNKDKDKDKDKDKERKKDKDKSLKSKELNDDTLNVSNHQTTTPTQHLNRISSTKPNLTQQPVQVHPPSQRSTTHLSDKSSSDYDMDDDYVARSTSPPPPPPPPPPPKSDINDTNSSMDHAIAEAPRSIQNDSPKKHAEKSSSNKKEKETKPTQSTATNKEDKKRKRKIKGEKLKSEPEVNSSGVVSGGGKRKIQSPLVNEEPSVKYSKKDDERSSMPIKKETIKKENTKPERISPVITSSNKLLAPISTPSSSSSSSESIPSISENRPKSESPSSDKTYIAQLKALQQKIMTLQDNDELQQVVDMIAATGCYEITRSTFDFDLCALDRTTVQRLQERLG